MKEEWRDIKGYEGLYQVSNVGNVRSLRFINNAVNKEQVKIRKKNYSKIHNRYYIDLVKDGVRKHITIHRLVAEAFIPNPNNYPVINHIDGNPCNNNVSNLEWCTYSHNSKHAYDMGLVPKLIEMNNNAKKRIVRDDGKMYSCAYECAKDMNVSVCSIRDVLKGRIKKCKGYTFRYEE